MSRSQLDKLGKRLVAEPTEEDFLLLQAVRLAYDDALGQVEAILNEMNLEPAGRLKTVQSIIEKLAREQGMGLKGMQDVAGVRVVVEGTRRDQDALVRQLARRLADYPQKIVDRRGKPTHGYRAVHLIVFYVGLPIEIQVRTPLQQLWAELSEKLGDQWGRQIRYGGLPDDPEMPVTPVLTRREVFATILQFSETIDVLERADAELDWILKEWGAGRVHLEHERAQELAEAHARVRERKEGFREVLTNLIRVFSPEPLP